MDAKPLTVNQIFKERARYCVPVYQRHYEWERKEQLEPLWSDIQDKADEILSGSQRHFSHYLGALILSEGKARIGEVPVKQIIDGQQRLTTLQIVLNALYRIAKERGETNLADILEQRIFNPDEAPVARRSNGRHKLWPTKYDREQYVDITLENFRELRDKYYYAYFSSGKLIVKQAPRMLAALHYFSDAAEEFICEPDSQGWQVRLTALVRAVLDQFSIVVISLDDEDDAQTIFSTLNARGKPLSALDLIRNDIFQRAAATGENTDVLFEEKWAEFEQSFWDAPEVQGRLTRKRVEFFLANVLTAERAELINLSKIYPEYRTYTDQANYATVDAEINRLLAYAPIYRALRNPDVKDNVGRIAQHLSDWDMTTAFPLIMSFELEMSAKHRDSAGVYKMLEAYTIRRACCGLSAQGYSNFFLAAIKFMRENGWNENNFATFLLQQTSDYTRFPTDTDFRDALVTQPIYKGGWEKRVRVILQALEQTLRTSKDDVITINAGFTVEHILPSKWAEHWPLSNGIRVPTQSYAEALYTYKLDEETIKAIEERERIKNTLGNLTLVTQALNSAISHGPFGLKRAELAQSALVLNRNIAAQDFWSEEQIIKRSMLLADKAVFYWTRPNLKEARYESP